MNVVELLSSLSAILAFARAHPVVTAFALVGWVLSVAYKSLPRETRKTLEQTYPRATGVLLVFLHALSDAIGAIRVLYWQVLKGQPRHEEGEPSDPSDPPSVPPPG